MHRSLLMPWRSASWTLSLISDANPNPNTLWQCLYTTVFLIYEWGNLNSLAYVWKELRPYTDARIFSICYRSTREILGFKEPPGESEATQELGNPRGPGAV